MPKVIFESQAMMVGRIMEGIALTPTVSKNHNIYTSEEILKARNLGVKLNADWEHTSESVGHVVYSLDESIPALKYRIEVNTERAKELKEGVHVVSIEADVDEVVKSCNKSGCYNLVQGLKMEGIGITKTPGVGTVTSRFVESFDWQGINDKVCESCNHVEPMIKEDDELKAKVEQLEVKIDYLSKPKCEKCGRIAKA